MIKIFSQWQGVFGPKLDLVGFTGPILLSLIFFYFFKLDISFTRSVFYYMGFNLFFNIAHVYSTYWYTYTSPAQWERNAFWLFSIPLILFVINLLTGYLFGYEFIFVFFSTFSIYHFVKQQQAWFYISKSRGSSKSSVHSWIDVAAINAVTWGFVLISQSHQQARGWLKSGDIIELPNWTEAPLYFVCGISLVLYVLKYLLLYFRSKEFDWGTHHILATAFIIWGYSRLASPTPLTFHFIQLHHAIPYLILGVCYILATRKTGNEYKLPHVNNILLMIGIYLIGIFIGTIEAGMRNGIGLIWDGPDLFDRNFGIIEASFWNTISLTHYVLDSIVWNKKHNPGWQKALFHQKASQP